MSVTQPSVSSKPSSTSVSFFLRVRHYWLQGALIVSLVGPLSFGFGVPAAHHAAHTLMRAHASFTSGMLTARMHPFPLCPGTLMPC